MLVRGLSPERCLPSKISYRVRSWWNKPLFYTMKPLFLILTKNDLFFCRYSSDFGRFAKRLAQPDIGLYKQLRGISIVHGDLKNLPSKVSTDLSVIILDSEFPIWWWCWQPYGWLDTTLYSLLFRDKFFKLLLLLTPISSTMLHEFATGSTFQYSNF